MIKQDQATIKKEVKIYKSLYEVKDKYLPNADLEFLESKDDEFSQDAFLRMLNKSSHSIKEKVDKKSK